MDPADYTVPNTWSCLFRSDSILDGMSSTSSQESPLSLFRPTSTSQCHSCSMKSELSQFEEKFKIRESILVGCDTISDLANKIPFLSEMRMFAESIQEKTVEAKPQDVCARWGTSEDVLITEYIKTFIRISDAWLSVRNCFGQDGRCMRKICCLDAKDLSAHYVDWMHSSRQLLQSIVQGLEKVNNDCTRNSGLRSNPPQVDGLWGYPPNPPCQCSLKPDTKALRPEPSARYNQPPPLYPRPPPGFTNMDNSTVDGGYMTPSSYDVPRNQLSASFRNNNVARVKSVIFKDSPIPNGYAVKFPKTIGKTSDDEMPHKAGSKGSFEKKFPESKSDSHSNFSKKDNQKKKLKKVWSTRRTSDQQPDQGQLRVSTEHELPQTDD